MGTKGMPVIKVSTGQVFNSMSEAAKDARLSESCFCKMVKECFDDEVGFDYKLLTERKKRKASTKTLDDLPPDFPFKICKKTCDNGAETLIAAIVDRANDDYISLWRKRVKLVKKTKKGKGVNKTAAKEELKNVLRELDEIESFFKGGVYGIIDNSKQSENMIMNLRLLALKKNAAAKKGGK